VVCPPFSISIHLVCHLPSFRKSSRNPVDPTALPRICASAPPVGRIMQDKHGTGDTMATRCGGHRSRFSTMLVSPAATTVAQTAQAAQRG
jgi:hypothetical protein